MTDLVRRYRNRSERTAFELFLGQAHGFRVRVVMVSLFAGFDLYVLEPVMVQQVPCQFAARAAVAVGWHAVLFKHALYPQTRAEHDDENDNSENNQAHGFENSSTIHSFMCSLSMTIHQ